MKRFLSLVIAMLVCIATLVGCKPKEAEPTNIIKAGELTQEQENILKLTDTQPPRLYDFEVQGAKSMKLEILTLENGEWVCHSSSLAAAPENSESYKGQIALMLTDPDNSFGGYSIAITDDNGFTRCTYEPYPNSKDYPDHSTVSIVETTVQLNETAGVLVLYGNERSRNSQLSYFPDEALERPEDIDSDIAVLLTVTFYDKPVSEVDN